VVRWIGLGNLEFFRVFFHLIISYSACRKKHKNYDWADYPEYDEGKHKINKYFFNNNKLCIKEKNTIKTESTYPNLFKGTDILNLEKENKFNPDKTVHESNNIVDD